MDESEAKYTNKQEIEAINRWRSECGKGFGLVWLYGLMAYQPLWVI